MLPILAGAVGTSLLSQFLDPESRLRGGIISGLSGGSANTGEELVRGMMGGGDSSMLTRGLGMGADMLLDPWTYAGGLAGGLAGKAGGMVKAGLKQKAAGAAGTRRVAQKAMVDHAGESADVLSAQQARMNELRKSIDPESLIDPKAVRTIKNPDPAYAKKVHAGNAGRYQKDDHVDELTMFPGSMKQKTVNRGHGKSGPVKPNAEGYAGAPIPKKNLPKKKGDFATTQERSMLAEEARRYGDPTSIHTPDIFNEVALRQAAGKMPPMPQIGGRAAGDVFQGSQNELTQLLAQLQSIEELKQQALTAALLGGGVGAGMGIGANL